MKYRHLGNSGLEVSVIGLGTNNFGGRMELKEAREVIFAALDEGINLIDTANIYSHGNSEEIIGRALVDRRDEALLATKFGMQWEDGPHGKGGSRKHVMDSLEGSLKRLQTGHIDLYQMHAQDPETPIEETLRALDDAVRDGKVRYIGLSNFVPWRIADAQWAARHNGFVPFISSQPEYSMLERGVERAVLPVCEHFGLGTLPYYPLAHGFLTGKYRRGKAVPEGTRLALAPAAQDKRLTDANFDILEQLEVFVEKRGHSTVELAFAWILARKSVGSVIAGASTPDQIRQNAAAAEWELTDNEMEELAGILDGR
ncbi:MAG: aldo/keto reductase [Dehalococcoidia bacterium]|jgi:aryl-alcohol dehydrogenase-like predicted oxidoreductase|nr:aldo/keto reductase [Dehalococcoidia bacterium]